MQELAEKILLSYLYDLLPRRPHANNIGQYFDKKTYRTKSGIVKTKTYTRWGDEKLKSQARRYFRMDNHNFCDICAVCDVAPDDILNLVGDCLRNNIDRIDGGRKLRSYFKFKQTKSLSSRPGYIKKRGIK